MKIYKTQEEVEKDIKDGVLLIDGDVKFECSISIDASIRARNITAWDITAGDITAWDINAGNISYWAFCNSYKSIKCKSYKARRNNHSEPVCLDGKIVIKKDNKKGELLQKADELIAKANELKEQAENL